MRLFFPGCLFHRMTGLYCPGCGGTRAFLYLIHGHPLLSLWFHPFVIYMLFMLIYYGACGIVRIAGHRQMTFKSWPLWGAFIVIAANCILKNMILIVGGVDPLKV